MKIITVLLLLSSLGFAQKSTTKAEKYTCVAGPDEQCASDLWYADYLKYEVLTKKYAPPQDIVDQMQGMQDRLIKSVPAGYTWDATKKRFVKIPVAQVSQQQQPAPVPQPAQQAPQPKEKK